MFLSDSQITTADLVHLKEYDGSFEDMDIDELILCAYADDLPLCDYLMAVVINDYDLGEEDSCQNQGINSH